MSDVMLGGKVAVVTGGGQGLGRCHALTLAGQGAAVVVNDLGDSADRVVEEIVAAGGQAVANRSSVSDWKASEALVRQAVDAFGDLHIVVNNAGVLRDKMSFNMDEDDWDTVIDVHLKGHFCVSRHAGVYWREQSKAGATAGRRIINTTSEAGLFGSVGQANYAAAKGGIVSLTWVFAREYQRYGVTANVIAPRARTQMTENMTGFEAPADPDQFDRMAPENVSRTVAWLASDDAADVSGQVFIVIGGDVHLVRGFEVVSAVHDDGPWPIEELAKAKGQLFANRSSSIPRFGGPM